MPGSSTWDETAVQLQKWYDHIIIPEMSQRPEPFGEWLVHDLKAVRGQPIGEKASIPLPVWIEAQGAFLLRENPRLRPRGPGIIAGQVRRAEPNWTIDLGPDPAVALVDFEGGNGPYIVPRKSLSGQPNFVQINDTASVEMLLMAHDGKLRVARSARDLADADRLKRAESWTTWLLKVNDDTLANKNRGGAPAGPGGPGGPTPPGGAP
jgi:hypothetical protein